MRKMAVALVALLLLGLARGEETAEEAKARKVRELVELNGFLDSVAGVPLSVVPDRARKQLVDLVIPAYGRGFDDETLDAALAFFGSAAGKRYLVSAPMGAESAASAVRGAEATMPGLVAVRTCKEHYDQAKVWRMVRGKYPASLRDMEGPLSEGDEDPFTTIEDDPWGHKYVLRVEGRMLRVMSFGPDGAEGTEDDIVYPSR